ncbi:MAG: insulinase family protein [Vicinamibacteria bacterium]|nr:insulinase family protein [Vicinamibacteria bacterium]
MQSKSHPRAFLLSLALSSFALAPMAPAAGAPEIRFETFVLGNGLTVIVHEDHKAPIVAVNVWYHVGSKNEKRGKTGFAHLFEHLMFNGTEHFDDDYFKALEKAGATDLNGTTNKDRTNYFQNVPTSALDLALFMESDRMGHLMGAVSQAKLDEQRGVVQNEKRQGENQPYGQSFTLISENTYPAGHPYSWSVIGSMDDLGAASMDDVKEWFRTYYGPNNAVLAIAGDITVADARARAEKFFGHIPPGPPIAKHEAWVAKMSGTKRGVLQDRVPQARLTMVWNVPQWGTPEETLLDVASDVLSGGKSSRLYKRLVYDEQIATSVFASLNPGEIGSQFMVMATAKPGGDLAQVEKAIREELDRFLKEGPTADELDRVKTQYRAQFARGIERIGGFGGKSDILATNMIYGGDAGAYKARLAREEAATAEDVKKAAQAWLSDGVYVLEVLPFPKLAAAGAGIDRARVPTLAAPPTAKLPATERAKLSNGLQLVVARRDGVPVVNFDLLVDAGYAADGAAPGTASLAMNLLDEGTAKKGALELSDELDRLGANLTTAATLDTCRVSLSALQEKLDASLALMAEVVLSPSFPQADFERLQKQQLAGIQREKVTPNAIGLRVMPALLYGAGHPYGAPFSGSGTEASVAALTRDQLAAFHRAWFKPNNTTLIVVGATSMAEIRPKLEALFAAWKAGDVPKKAIATVAPKAKSELYVIDRPGSQQSLIFAGLLAPPKNNPDEIPFELMQEALGGSFTSRINMNLREDKHWSYGARMALPDARGQRPYFVAAPVQSDKTAESVAEVAKELRAIVGDKPLTADELAKAQGNLTLTLPGTWETNRAVAATLAEIAQFGLPADHFDTYPARVRAQQLAAVNAVAKKIVTPERVVYVVVGDREKIEAPLRALNLGELRLIDADGKPATAPAAKPTP